MTSSCSIILQDDIVATVYQYSYKIIISPDLKQVYCCLLLQPGVAVIPPVYSWIFML